MGKNSEIAWTDHTWNPWQGCRPVSPGCKNCYMFREKHRYGQDGSDIHRSTLATFRKPLFWKDPAKVFTCSWSDFFIEEADAWRPDAWEIIQRTPHLTYQILTKRPERIMDCLPADWPLPNVWLGVTGENEEWAFNRLRMLLMVPASVHFLSAEPLVGPIDLEEIVHVLNCHIGLEHHLDWVICGGESGPGARNMSEGWARGLMHDCDLLDIPFFMKQMSGVNPKKIPIPETLNVTEFPGEFQSA